MKLNWVTKLLFFIPGVLFYIPAVQIRNWLFDIDLFKSYISKIPIICVGNVSFGGTGKTPVVSFLAKTFLEREFSVFILSRGYKRKKQGLVNVSPEHTATEIGDEPYLLFHSLEKKVPVILSNRRVVGVKYVESLKKKRTIIIMDDGFQHRWVKPSYSLLLSPQSKLFFRDAIFPFGELRDVKRSQKRANALFITKSSDCEQKQVAFAAKKTVFLEKNIFQTKVVYGSLLSENGEKNHFPKSTKVLVMSGIGNSQDFEAYVKTLFSEVSVLSFSDHYSYSEKKIEEIMLLNSDCELIITTEKDFVKIKDIEIQKKRRIPVCFIPISIEFCDQNKREMFLETVLSKISLS